MFFSKREKATTPRPVLVCGPGLGTTAVNNRNKCLLIPFNPLAYLHGHGVFDEHRSELSVEFKEDLSLPGLVQVTQGQRLDVEGLPPLQLHLRLKRRWDEEKGRDGH